ncbi:inactive peptidyl-prolyl cis-trans isomerase shutdown-like [Phlebotomus argentipes]|uniref:inactive peptidyl-prolyl cis-trans isomerase shutdown-like n=1 Tax=Phlebotomus argentipes TaxID=94469 RepID=UPI002892E52B|nr:inactive peptidyl-prolyl cis-trans isomerase shutdown-like [Phlebotomus argentipes]
MAELKDGVLSATAQNIQDLIAGNSMHLKVDAQEQQDYDSEDEFGEQYEEAARKWSNADFVQKSFDEIRQEMTEIGMGIYKKVVVEGSGDTIPAQNAKVTMVYSVFAEKEAFPVDSSLLTGKNHSFVTGHDTGLLVGIQHAAMSMRAQEQAQFIIPYRHLYNEHGCPPRIPAKMDGLVLIRIVQVEPEWVDPRAQESQPKDFSGVKKSVEKLSEQGRAAIVKHRFSSALRSYNEAIRILHSVSLDTGTAGKEEEQERIRLIVRMLINSGITYNKMCQPSSACMRFDEAQKHLASISATQKGKLLLHKARSLRSLGEYQKAGECLSLAQKCCDAPEIIRELRELNQDRANSNKDMCNMMRKAFNIQDTTPKVKVSTVNRNFEAWFRQTVKKFVENEKLTKQMISFDITKDQRKIIDDVLAKENGVALHAQPSENTTRYCLAKEVSQE